MRVESDTRNARARSNGRGRASRGGAPSTRGESGDGPRSRGRARTRCASRGRLRTLARARARHWRGRWRRRGRPGSCELRATDGAALGCGCRTRPLLPRFGVLRCGRGRHWAALRVGIVAVGDSPSRRALAMWCRELGESHMGRRRCASSGDRDGWVGRAGGMRFKVSELSEIL